MNKLNTDKIRRGLADNQLRVNEQVTDVTARHFQRTQTQILKDAVKDAADKIVESQDKSKDREITNVVKVDSPKLDAIDSKLNNIRVATINNKPDNSGIVKGLESVVEAVRAIPEPKEVNIPAPIDTAPLLRHMSGQLDKLYRKEQPQPVFDPSITVNPTPVEVNVDVDRALDALALTNAHLSSLAEQVSLVAGSISNDPSDKIIKVLRRIDDSLDAIKEKPQVTGGGGGSGGHATPYLDGSSNPTYVYENPTDRYSVSDVDEVGDPKYYGFLRADGAWYIMRSTTDTTYRYAAGTSGYNWANRASETYGLFNEVF